MSALSWAETVFPEIPPEIVPDECGPQGKKHFAVRFGKQKWSIAGRYKAPCHLHLGSSYWNGTTNNPKIISKCFNCVHMWLRNYSVNIWGKLMVVSFIVLRIVVAIQPETHQHIFLGQRPKFLIHSCLLFCSLHFTQAPEVTLVLKVQFPQPCENHWLRLLP